MSLVRGSCSTAGRGIRDDDDDDDEEEEEDADGDWARCAAAIAAAAGDGGGGGSGVSLIGVVAEAGLGVLHSSHRLSRGELAKVHASHDHSVAEDSKEDDDEDEDEEDEESAVVDSVSSRFFSSIASRSSLVRSMLGLPQAHGTAAMRRGVS